MVKGYYKTNAAIPCNKEDRKFFRRMMRNEPENRQEDVFVRQVKPGDVLISETNVKRWRIVSDDGKLYLGFYEKPEQEMCYQGLKCPIAYYAVIEDDRKNSQQKYILSRIPNWMAWREIEL